MTNVHYLQQWKYLYELITVGSEYTVVRNVLCATLAYSPSSFIWGYNTTHFWRFSSHQASVPASTLILDCLSFKAMRNTFLFLMHYIGLGANIVSLSASGGLLAILGIYGLVENSFISPFISTLCSVYVRGCWTELTISHVKWDLTAKWCQVLSRESLVTAGKISWQNT